MEKLIINIGASKDHFGAYAENASGIYAAGNTVAETKRDVLEAIRLIKGEYSIEWKYDTQSLLQHYSGIFTNAALERMTGINQKQLWNYANGISKPRENVRRKIEKALHSLGEELIALSL